MRLCLLQLLVPSQLLQQLNPTGVAVDPPHLPLWCSLATRIVSPKSAESTCPGILQAIKIFGSVRELSSWMNDPLIAEAVVARAFLIIGIKNSVLSEDH